MLQAIVNKMDAEQIINNLSNFLGGESELSEESDQWITRHVSSLASMIMHYISSDFRAFVVLKCTPTILTHVFGTLLLCLK